jgi:hypothetical protein
MPQVVFIWSQDPDPPAKKHAILEQVPAVGDLVIAPGETLPRNVRAREWDCSRGNGKNAIIHIALD